MQSQARAVHRPHTASSPDQPSFVSQTATQRQLPRGAAGLPGEAITCPHCRSRRVTKWGAAHGLPRYRCLDCARTYNILTKTALARLRNKELWLTFVGTMVEGRSVRKSALACGVSAATIVRWRRRFTACTGEQKARILTSILGACTRGDYLRHATDAVPDEFRSWFTNLVPVLLSWML
jgi:transposase-like protein